MKTTVFENFRENGGIYSRKRVIPEDNDILLKSMYFCLSPTLCAALNFLIYFKSFFSQETLGEYKTRKGFEPTTSCEFVIMPCSIALPCCCTFPAKSASVHTCRRLWVRIPPDSYSGILFPPRPHSLKSLHRVHIGNGVASPFIYGVNWGPAVHLYCSPIWFVHIFNRFFKQ